MKRPWLLTPAGQRVSMLLSYLLSLMLLVLLALQIQLVENPRSLVPQLNPKDLSSCELSDCSALEGHLGLLPVGYQVSQGDSINTLTVRFENPGRLQGKRTLWLELRDDSGKWLEAASAELEIGQHGPVVIEFGFTQPVDALLSGILRLSY